jgi:hypothetical protein
MLGALVQWDKDSKFALAVVLEARIEGLWNRMHTKTVVVDEIVFVTLCVVLKVSAVLK